jgi:hypothetical protein
VSPSTEFRERSSARLSARGSALMVGAGVWFVAWMLVAINQGRTLTYRTDTPRALATIERSAVFSIADGHLVVSDVDVWKVRITRVDLATGASRGPVATDLEPLTRQAFLASQPRPPRQQPKDQAAPYSAPVQQRMPPSSGYGETLTARTGVSVSPDGSSVAWVVGSALLIVRPRAPATSASREPGSIPVAPAGRVSLTRVSGEACVPVLGAAVLALACEGALELRGLRSGELLRTIPGPHRVLRTPEGAMYAASGGELFAIASDGAPGRRTFVPAPPRAVLETSFGQLAVATDDGTVMLTGERGATLGVTAPGAVDAFAVLQPNVVVVGGAFRGVHVLSSNGASRPLIADVIGTRFLHLPGGQRIVYATADRLATASWTSARAFTPMGSLYIGIAALPLMLAAFALVWARASHRYFPEGPAAQPVPVSAEPPPQLPPPEPPPGLVKACLDGECVLYAGAGLSAQAGYPTWQPFVAGLLEWSRDTKRIDAEFAASLQTALAAGRVDSVADSLLSIVGRQEILARAQETFGRELRVPQTYRLLKQIPFTAALTANLDTLLERTYPDVLDKVLTPRNADRITELLGKREFFIAKLYGSLSSPPSVLVGPADYVEAVSRNQPFSHSLEGIFVSRTLLFVGASLEGIEAYLSGLTFRGQMTRPHYALVAVTDAGWRAKAEPLRRRYGIEVLPYTPSADFSEVPAFLEKLAVAVGAANAGVRAAPAVDGLRRLVLENIGPFQSLEVTLESDWNVILGDNGVGKSSILRAIAACFCGKDAEPYAARLIRAGEPSGSIVLETARNTYRMQLRRTDRGADLTVVPSRPLEAEGILALGFPPLRAVSWERPKGPTSEGRSRAAVEDLLPIVKGDPDPRLDRLKQWIVNLDARINYEKTRGDDDRYERLLGRFFEIVDQVTPGMSIRFGRVDPATREVTVVTDDGEIPIEMVSQGSVSLMGWIGVLLQRLFEIYGDDVDPTRRYALVLIDEIDAHMHPEWQQAVVHHMNSIFPNVQYIATTHSPLVVGGLKASQVQRFVRGAGGATRPVPVTDEMLVGRADQILTGRLFGMKTTLDQQTQAAMERYKLLLGKSQRTPEEEEEFQQLHRALKFKIPLAEETAAERKAFALVEAIVNDQLGALVPDARRPLVERARALIDEISAADESASKRGAV